MWEFLLWISIVFLVGLVYFVFVIFVVFVFLFLFLFLWCQCCVLLQQFLMWVFIRCQIINKQSWLFLSCGLVVICLLFLFIFSCGFVDTCLGGFSFSFLFLVAWLPHDLVVLIINLVVVFHLNACFCFFFYVLLHLSLCWTLHFLHLLLSWTFWYTEGRRRLYYRRGARFVSWIF